VLCKYHRQYAYNLIHHFKIEANYILVSFKKHFKLLLV